MLLKWATIERLWLLEFYIYTRRQPGKLNIRSSILVWSLRSSFFCIYLPFVSLIFLLTLDVWEEIPAEWEAQHTMKKQFQWLNSFSVVYYCFFPLLHFSVDIYRNTYICMFRLSANLVWGYSCHAHTHTSGHTMISELLLGPQPWQTAVGLSASWAYQKHCLFPGAYVI